MKSIKTSSNTTITYKDEGNGHPIVLIHGFMGDHRYWDTLFSSLTNHSRVIVLDLPGHGSSSMPNQNLSIEEYAAEIDSFLEQLQLSQVTLIGHSLGGYITAAFAELYAHRLARFAFIHSTALPDTEESKKNREAGINAIQKDGVHPFVDGLIPKLFAQDHHQRNADAIQYAKEIGYHTSEAGAISALYAMRDRPNRVKVLEDTQLPVLVVAGSDDGVVPPKRAFTTDRPNIQHVLLQDVGHMSMYEAPESLLSALENFIKSPSI
ncbi:Pimeloyl-ACP methyl ester carboxylesterase [Seinonella peptonophila]|uniref:Pimeloyl-ACP methyl ester carboxylesterase n=1 Tax=Seinonella peptonophila TaxID=112248 RepID=A0A1M4X0E3_9BACL|nr:alpha/beta hydrolase [Seinonella peptonophila]SHE86978.1 Pimeloyl-ACP methyl ester carboxylesterase [Seinonella peptonophila]